jgi:hypothetical protein
LVEPGSLPLLLLRFDRHVDPRDVTMSSSA